MGNGLIATRPNLVFNILIATLIGSPLHIWLGFGNYKRKPSLRKISRQIRYMIDGKLYRIAVLFDSLKTEKESVFKQLLSTCRKRLVCDSYRNETILSLQKS